MRVLAVMDVMGGVAVRAVAGRRSHYRPLETWLAAEPVPALVARGFREQFGIDELYLADLDALLGGEPLAALPLAKAVQAAGVRVWLEAGVRNADQAAALAAGGVDVIVAGLETVENPAELAAMAERLGPERVVFSLDLMGGVPLAAREPWPPEPLAIFATALRSGIRRVMMLDLERVGTCKGMGSEGLAEAALRYAAGQPFATELWLSGGIDGLDDLRFAKALGAAGVLAASALHLQRISPAELQTFLAGEAG